MCNGWWRFPTWLRELKYGDDPLHAVMEERALIILKFVYTCRELLVFCLEMPSMEEEKKVGAVGGGGEWAAAAAARARAG